MTNLFSSIAFQRQGRTTVLALGIIGIVTAFTPSPGHAQTATANSFSTATTGDYRPLAIRGDLYHWYLKQTGDTAERNTVEIAVEDDEEQTRSPALDLPLSNRITGQPRFDGPDKLKSNEPGFDPAAFEQHLRNSMQGNAIGYSFAINHKMKLYKADGVGWARAPQDAVNNVLADHLQSATRRMNIASISKTLTAVAVLQLLEKNDLSVYSPISPWLPAEWVAGYGMSPLYDYSLTFYDLLTHRSGLKQAMTDLEQYDPAFKALDKVKWDGMEAMVNHGTDPAQVGKYAYSNVNYALFRAMIPKLWKASGERPEINDTLDAESAAAWYATYMAEKLYIPLGIHQAQCKDTTDSIKITLMYNVYDPARKGAAVSDWSLRCGSGVWVLSSFDLAKLMAHIRYNDNILSSDMRTLMDDLRLGWRAVDGDHGKYLSHGGALYMDDTPHGERREMQGCVMKFPIQVEAVLLVNSSIVDNVKPCTKLAEAFDAAWH